MGLLKQTPIYELYERYGAKTIDFGGWNLPVQFSSIKDEHHAVRQKAGLFDVSHMGEIEVKGKGAFLYLQSLLTNDLANLTVGKAQYHLMCNENGGTIDDLLVYKRGDDHYLLVVNAANIEKDYEWLTKHLIDDVEVHNLSTKYALLALQGPLAEKVLQPLTTANVTRLANFHFLDEVLIAGVSVLLSRTGYTGEDGFEMYCKAEDAKKLWLAILDAGEGEVIPCGLGARDTLRFEARLPLYGQELSERISPLEAGLGFAVKLGKESDFIGKEALQQQKEAGILRKLVGIEMIDKGIPRTGYSVLVNGHPIGLVTSGTQSPTLKKNIGLAIVNKEFSDLGTIVDVQIRNNARKAKVVETPFYKRTMKENE